MSAGPGGRGRWYGLHASVAATHQMPVACTGEEMGRVRMYLLNKASAYLIRLAVAKVCWGSTYHKTAPYCFMIAAPKLDLAVNRFAGGSALPTGFRA